MNKNYRKIKRPKAVNNPSHGTEESAFTPLVVEFSGKFPEVEPKYPEEDRVEEISELKVPAVVVPDPLPDVVDKELPTAEEEVLEEESDNEEVDKGEKVVPLEDDGIFTKASVQL